MCRNENFILLIVKYKIKIQSYFVSKYLLIYYLVNYLYRGSILKILFYFSGQFNQKPAITYLICQLQTLYHQESLHYLLTM